MDIAAMGDSVSQTFAAIWHDLDYLKLVQITLLLVALGIGFRLLRSLILRIVAGRVSDQTHMLFRKVLGWLSLSILVVVFFGSLGFDLTAVLGAAGIVGIAVGFAAQTSISNVISGLFLLSEKPFAVGDIINTEGVMGVVLSIDTLSVKVRTFDNTFVRLPNETLIKSKVVNVTRFPIRRLDLVLTIPHGQDLARALRVIPEVVAGNRYALANPEYFLSVRQLVLAGTEVSLGVWFERSDMTELKNSITIELLERFQKEQITLPRPWFTWEGLQDG